MTKFCAFLCFVVKYSKALTALWSIPTLWQEPVLPIIIIIMFYKNNTVGGCQTLLCVASVVQMKIAHSQVRNPPWMLVYGIEWLIDWFYFFIIFKLYICLVKVWLLRKLLSNTVPQWFSTSVILLSLWHYYSFWYLNVFFYIFSVIILFTVLVI